MVATVSPLFRAGGADARGVVRWRFCEFEFDVEQAELRRAGQLVEAPALSLALLEHLLTQRDRVVSREELLAHVWRGIAVSEGSLRQAIFGLRQLLGDDADEPRIVRTIRGRGYRFVAAVSAGEREASADEPCSISGPSAAPRRVQTFFGRSDELARLERALREANGEAGRACVLRGPPGIGKSRLAAELAQIARERGAACYDAVTDPDGAAPAFWPWSWMFRDRLEQLPSAARSASAARFPNAWRSLEGTAGVPGPVASFESARSEQRFALLGELGELFVSLFAQAPGLLLLDDLQWADAASLALLRQLAALLPRTRSLLLITCRNAAAGKDPRLTRALSALRRAPLNFELELSSLKPEDVTGMVALHAGDGCGTELCSWVHALSDGNPLFAAELALLFAPTKRAPDEAWSEGHSDIQAVVQRRLESLPAPVLSALLAASVLSAEFSLAELAHLLDEPVQETLGRIDGCIEHGMLRDGSGPSFRFAHPTLREAAYGLVARAERVRLHRRAAEWIEASATHTRATVLNELARHFFAAAPSGCSGKAIEYAVACAERAYAVTAYDDAIAQYDRALACAALDPAVSRETSLELALLRGESLRASGADPQQVNRLFLELAERAEVLGDAQLFARAVLGYTGQRALRHTFTRFPTSEQREEIALIERALRAVGEGPSEARALLLCSLVGARLYNRDATLRERALQEATAVADTLGVASVRLRVLATRIHCCATPDDREARLHACDTLIALAREHGLRAQEADGLIARAVLALGRGELAAAQRDAERARLLADELNSPQIRARSELLNLLRAFWQGEAQEAQRLTERALEMAPEDLIQRTFHVLRVSSLKLMRDGVIADQLPLYQSMLQRYPDAVGFHCSLASIYATLGDREAAQYHFDAVARDGFAQLPKDVHWLGELALLADSARHLDDPERARLVYDQLLPYGDVFDIFLGEAVPAGPVAFWLAGLAVTRREFAAARRWLSVAKDLNERLGATMLVHYTALVEARLLSLSEPGGVQAAQELVREVIAFAEPRGLGWLRSRAELEAESLARASAVNAESCAPSSR